MAEQEYQENVAHILEDEQLSEADKIKALDELGFSRKQLIEEFAFSKTSVYRVLPVNPEGKDTKKDDSWNDGLPVVRKMGGGMEVINPEAVLRRYMDSESDVLELRGMMKLRAAMLMVMDLVNIQKGAAEADAKRLEPILRLMKETREEQDAAAQRAKASTTEIAQQAAQDAVGGVLSYIEQKIPQGPPPKTVDEAYAKRVDKVMDMMWNVMERQMMPGSQQNQPPEGWEYEKLGAQPGSSPQDTAPSQTGDTSQNWEHEERKEGESNV